MSGAHTPVLTLDEIQGGPINNSRTVKELVGIATAMGISVLGNKPALLARVQEKLRTDKELAEKPEFLKFSIHRAKKAGKPPKNTKNSATKAAEDAAEAKLDLPAIGANRKLLEGDTKTDPPAQYGRLKGPLFKEIESDDEKDHYGGSRFSSLSPSLPDKSEHEKDEPSTPRKERKVIIPETPKQICVVFNGANPREIIIESSKRVPLTVENQGVDGTSPFYSASLKEVLNEVIKLDTPMRDNGKAKVYRAGLYDPGVPSIKLGSVDEILADKSAQLRINNVDKYNLEPFNNGMLLCKLFLVDGDDTKDTKVAKAENVGPIRLVDGSSKPLEVAKNRAAVMALIQPSKDVAFLAFLGEILGARTADWPNAETARDVRDRYVAVIDAIAQLKSMGWSKSGGGYQVPWEYKESLYNEEYDFKGYVFTKDTVLKAMRIGHAVAGTDNQTMGLLQHCPDALAWFNSPDDEILGPKFNGMKNRDFKKRLERKREEAIKQKSKDKARRAKERESKAAKKRARQSSEAEESASASEKESRPSKKKAKSKRVYDSDDDIDGSSE
ncbi:hypothetical protein B0H11DRAFT_2280372 [Mycena galericulata]|nr:hypothetical protein B0H11DRAFT_2280372 [Mycena galericulata]